MAILMRCTLLVTWAPISRRFRVPPPASCGRRSLSRGRAERGRGPQVALASSVWARPMRRSAVSTTQAIEANQSRSWLACTVAALVHSTPRSKLRGGGSGVGEEVGLALIDEVRHFAAGAVDVFVERPRVGLGKLLRGDDEARIGAFLTSVRHPLRFGDDAPAPRPAVLGGPRKVGAAAGGATLTLGLVLSPTRARTLRDPSAKRPRSGERGGASSVSMCVTSRGLRARSKTKSTRCVSHQRLVDDILHRSGRGVKGGAA